MQRAVHPGVSGRWRRHGRGRHASTWCPPTPARRSPTSARGPWWLQAYLPTDREAMLPVLEAAVAGRAPGPSCSPPTRRSPGPSTPPTTPTGPGSTSAGGGRTSPTRPPTPWKRATSTPADVTWLRERAGVPVVVKGVLRGDDALRCLARRRRRRSGCPTTAAASSTAAVPHRPRACARSSRPWGTGPRCTSTGASGPASTRWRPSRSGPARSSSAAPPSTGWPSTVPAGSTRVLRDLETELREALELAGCATLDEARDLLAVPPDRPLTCGDAPGPAHADPDLRRRRATPYCSPLSPWCGGEQDRARIGRPAPARRPSASQLNPSPGRLVARLIFENSTVCLSMNWFV